MMVWKMIFLFQGARILRLYVNLLGCKWDDPPLWPSFCGEISPIPSRVARRWTSKFVAWIREMSVYLGDDGLPKGDRYAPRNLTYSPWKMMVGRWVSLLGLPIFRGYVKFLGCIYRGKTNFGIEKWRCRRFSRCYFVLSSLKQTSSPIEEDFSPHI